MKTIEQKISMAKYALAKDRPLPKSFFAAAGLLKDRREDLLRYYKKQRRQWKRRAL